VEGGLILGRLLHDSTILPRQILLFRAHDFHAAAGLRQPVHSRFAHSRNDFSTRKPGKVALTPLPPCLH